MECDHLRQIIRHPNGRWHHVSPDGGLGGECGASSIYKVNATATSDHNTATWAGPR